MQISPRGLLLIERFEGFRSQRYLDSVGVPTIGFGTTAGDLGHPVPESCTLAQATAWLKDGIQRQYAKPIDQLIDGGLKLTQNEYDALCSLSYNLGPGVISDTGTYSMARDLAAHNIGAAAGDFMHYVMAGGQVLPGLVARRRAEQQLFLTPPPVPPDPQHYLWYDDTVRNLGRGRKASERALVREYDRERAKWRLFPRRLRALRDDMSILAGRLKDVMKDDSAHNAANHRAFRIDGLERRAAGKRLV